MTTPIPAAISGNRRPNRLAGHLRLASALHGLGGNDTLIGGRNSDHLIGGPGRDTLIGRKGADLFVLDGGAPDRIINFDDDEGDVIGIRRSLLPSGELSFIRLHDSRLLSWYATSGAALVYLISGSLYLNANGRRPGFGANGGLIAELGPTDLSIESIAVIP